MAATPTTDSALDSPPAVAYRLPCVGCGYDLIGLAEDGPCPECGIPIGRSISGDHLVASSAEHRHALARGARLAHAGAVAGWGALGVSALAVLLHGLGWRVGWVALPLLCAAVVPTALGWLALTRDDPEGVAKHNPAVAGERLFIRLWAMVALTSGACLLVLWVLALAATPRASFESLLATAAASFMLLGAALAISRDLAKLSANLARRLLEGELADRALGLMPTGYAALALLAIALAMTIAPLGGWWWLARPVAWTVAGVAVLAWAIVYSTVVRTLARALAAIAPRDAPLK